RPRGFPRMGSSSEGSVPQAAAAAGGLCGTRQVLHRAPTIPYESETRLSVRLVSCCARNLVLGMLSLGAALVSPMAEAAGAFSPDGVDVTGGYGNNVAIYGIGVHWESLCACAALKSAGFDVRLLAQ